MRWFKKQWNENKEFRAAVVVVASIGLSAAGLPPQLASAVAAIVGAAGF